MMDLSDWIEDNPDSRSGNPCWLCDRPHLRRQVVAHRDAGGQISNAARWLKDEHEMANSPSAVNRCLQLHEDRHGS